MRPAEHAPRLNWRRSSPLRMGLSFSALYLVCFASAGAMNYQLMQDRLMQRIDATIIEQYGAVQELYDTLGVDAVVQLSQARDSEPMSYSMGFHLATADGQRLAGNIPYCETDTGWSNVLGEQLGIESDAEYRFLTASMGDYVLSIGKSLREMDELRHSAVGGFVWAFLLSTLLAGAGTVAMAYRTHCRLSRISDAMQRVAGGRLDSRLPISSSQDDIDQLSDKMNAALENLQNTVEGMRQVSTDIAHDLKTPLNRLYIQLEEAADKARAAGRDDTEWQLAAQEAERINSTFEALLRIAQIEAGARRAQFRKVELIDIANTVHEVYQAVAEESGQQLDLDIASEAITTVSGDRELLMQLLVNLIENAIRHCPTDTRIHLTVRTDGARPCLRVCDDGPGVPEAERERIFQRLYRLDSSRSTDGTGLGLSQVRAIAELHRAEIVVSDAQPGLCIDILFPA